MRNRGSRGSQSILIFFLVVILFVLSSIYFSSISLRQVQFQFQVGPSSSSSSSSSGETQVASSHQHQQDFSSSDHRNSTNSTNSTDSTDSANENTNEIDENENASHDENERDEDQGEIDGASSNDEEENSIGENIQENEQDHDQQQQQQQQVGEDGDGKEEEKKEDAMDGMDEGEQTKTEEGENAIKEGDGENSHIIGDKGEISIETSVTSINITSMTTIIEMSSNNSTLQSDIVHITHDPNEASITVHLKKLSNNISTFTERKFKSESESQSETVRKCLNPIIRGRLSGPALSMIQWTPHYANNTLVDADADADANTFTNTNTNTNTNTITDTLVVEKIVGRYNVPSSGRYYVEVIGIMCNHRFHIKGDDFRESCLVQPSHHRLTADGAYIDIDIDIDVDVDIDNNTDNNVLNKQMSNSTGTSIEGYWKWNETNDDTTNSHQQQQQIQLQLQDQQQQPTQQPPPLYTRYQPLFCRGDENKTLSRCIDNIDISRYDPYQFEFHPDLKSRIERSIASSSLSPMTWPSAAADGGNTTEIVMANTTVCIVGFSHTRHMVDSMRSVLYYQNSNIQVQWVKAK